MESTMLETGAEPGGRAEPDDGRDPGPENRPRRRTTSVFQVAALIGLLAFGLRVWAPGPVTQTVDEFAWYLCSESFRNGLVDGDLGDMSTSAVAGPWMTQPGVATMWAGTIGYGLVSVGQGLGVVDDDPGMTHADRGRILRGGRVVVSAITAATLVALVIAAARLLGRRAAVIAGLLLAAEPWLVGHSHVLHTDAMVTMFGALAIVALAAAGHDRAAPVDRRMLVLAGVGAGLTALTKLNGIPLVVGGAAVVLVLQTDWRRANLAASLRRTVLVGLSFVGVAVAVFFVLWPALWVNPWSELQRLPRSLDQLSTQNATFFRYAVHADPGPAYYPVALVIRLSPWLLIAAAASAAAAVVHLVRRAGDKGSADTPGSWPAAPVLAVLLLAPVPYAVLIALTGQKYDRYALPVVPYVALLAGVGVAIAAKRWSERFGDRPLVLAAVAVTVAMVAVTVAFQPYAISFANPLVGGQKRARNIIMLGWGEGYEVVGQEIKRREGGNCDDAQIFTSNVFTDFIAVPCGEMMRGGEPGPGDYFIRYISATQRTPGNPVEVDIMQRGELVKAVNVYGVNYAELWQLPE